MYIVSFIIYMYNYLYKRILIKIINVTVLNYNS